MWDFVVFALAVVGFFAILAKVEDYVNLRGGAHVAKQAIWVLISVALALSWVGGTFAASQKYGAFGGAVTSIVIIGGLVGGIAIVGKFTRGKRDAGSIPKAGTS